MAQFFCRICDSNNRWTKPSGVAQDGPRSHFGRFGFAYEEWNFNKALQDADGWQHGWLDGFKYKTIPPGPHDVALYVLRKGTPYLIGRIRDCENTSRKEIGIRRRYPEELAADLENIPNLTVTVDGHKWTIRRDNAGEYVGEPITNIRFRRDSVEWMDNPTELDFNYPRYGALRVDEYQDRVELGNTLFPEREFRAE